MSEYLRLIARLNESMLISTNKLDLPNNFSVLG